ncbi:hypothetical protein BGW39_006872 [Mortierella sp. 14UC]|nr:hypothetical protein BGW39_006872 [Mortierella sp. 14UC]
MTGALDIFIANSEVKSVNFTYKYTDLVFDIIERIWLQLAIKLEAISKQELYVNGRSHQKGIDYYWIIGHILIYRALIMFTIQAKTLSLTIRVHILACHKLVHVVEVEALIEQLS